LDFNIKANFDIDPSRIATRIVDKIHPWPWRSLAAVLIGSFIIASAVSTLIGYLMMERASTKVSLQSLSAEPFDWSTSPTLTKSQVDKILDRNLFNSEGQMGDIDASTNNGNAATKTTLPIKIVGIIYGGNPYAGLAMIENTEKKTVNSFLVGDPLTPEAKIIEIHPDQVFIENMGRREFALLEEPEIRRSNRTGKRSRSPSGSGGSGPVDAGSENYQEEGFVRQGGKIEMTQEYKNRLLSVDFATVLQDAKASPNVVDGVLKGWKMDRIRKGSIYEKVGIQNGDVIEEINGAALSDAGQSVKTLQSMRNEDTIEIRGNRNGQVFTKTLKVR